MPMNPRLLRPLASGTFNPKTLSGIVGWWDANATSSLFQVSTGTTAVSATNDPVGYWGDLSGNGNHLTQSITNNRPFWITGAINGLPALSFDGSNDTLGRAFTLAQPCHHFCVFKFNGAYVSGNPRAWDGFGVTAGLYRANATSMVNNYGTSNDTATVTDAEMQDFGIWETQSNGTSSQVLRGGTRRDAADANIGTNSPSGIRLAVFQNGFSAPADLSIAELVIYNRILSGFEASKVRGYLGKKYNLAYA